MYNLEAKLNEVLDSLEAETKLPDDQTISQTIILYLEELRKRKKV